MPELQDNNSPPTFKPPSSRSEVTHSLHAPADLLPSPGTQIDAGARRLFLTTSSPWYKTSSIQACLTNHAPADLLPLRVLRSMSGHEDDDFWYLSARTTEPKISALYFPADLLPVKGTQIDVGEQRKLSTSIASRRGFPFRHTIRHLILVSCIDHVQNRRFFRHSLLETVTIRDVAYPPCSTTKESTHQTTRVANSPSIHKLFSRS